MARLAILDKESCRLKDCGRECVKYCPMVRSRLEAISFGSPDLPPTIHEALCSGCGICVKKCPFKAISIVNIAEELEGEAFHRFSVNGFKLFRFPSIPSGAVTGLVGINGIGKTTIMRILAGELLPNLGRFDGPPSKTDVLRFLRGSVSQELLEGIWKGKAKAVLKPQYVDRIPSIVRGTAGELIEHNDENGNARYVAHSLGLAKIWDRDVSVLSGGELQRLAITVACSKRADLLLFDEPSSFLDIEQRLAACKTIRGLSNDKMIVVVEHDLSMLDYVSDYVSVIYGRAGVYGIVSPIMSSRVGINSYLNGYIQGENVLFRDEPIIFHERPPPIYRDRPPLFSWGHQELSLGNFDLSIDGGQASEGDVLGIIGPNGIGKTTFIRNLAEKSAPIFFNEVRARNLVVSHKPQYLSDLYKGQVTQVLSSSLGESKAESISSELVHSFRLERLLDRDCESLSGGELQCVAIISALSKDADIYFLDEPCAYLDVEQRMAVIRATRRLTEMRGASAFVAEHDVVAMDFMADKLVVFDGEPGIRGHASPPADMRSGMNAFLAGRDVTFRRDPETHRPRVNKPGSKADKAQKLIGEYYYGIASEG
jgi:ATP-binding cassette subfamily E protein 1